MNLPGAGFDPSQPGEITGAGLYVHVPFCETKCGYCDFYSIPLGGRETAPLVQSLIRELKVRVVDPKIPVRTVFLGGGTPTLLPVSELSDLLQAVSDAVDTGCRDQGPIAEFTVEANPATVDQAKGRLLSRSGVDRVSLGAQSFHPSELRVLERIHDPDDVERSVRLLRSAGDFRLNLDLIFGVPGQTLESWGDSLSRALALEPDHLACYGLTYEPKTRLTALQSLGKLTPCEEELEADMYRQAVELLTDAGFRQYEISNFALPGCECLHNLGYWSGHPYVGLGPSAAGCDGYRRYRNIPDVHGYVRAIEDRGCAEAESEELTLEMRILESVLLELRLLRGLNVERFHRRFGMDPHRLFADPLARLAPMGLLEISETRMALTPAGRLMADAVIREFACAVEVDNDISAGVGVTPCIRPKLEGGRIHASISLPVYPPG